MKSRGALASALTILAAGCGARGAPLPPLRIVPPALPSAEVAQLGTRALVRFLPIADTIDMGNENEIAIARAELLMLTERYPALTASILAQGLDRERAARLELARRAVALATESAEARRQAEERRAAEAAAEAAGIVLPPEEVSAPEEEPAEEEELITEEQRLLNRLPGNTLRQWREAGLEGNILVEAARWFDEAVDELWDLLGMPTAIFDTRRPPQLPLPSLIVEKAAQLARTHPYEGSLEVADFLTRAAVVATIPFEDINDYMVDGSVRIDYNIGTSSSGPVRTRYYFAARAVDTEGNEGRIDRIMALAPGGVPLAPADLEVEVTPAGARLNWTAPAGDVWGDLIDSDAISYNIYRRVVDSDIVSVTPINYAPVTDTEYLDSTMSWGDRYRYEVRAVAAPPTSGDTPRLVEPEPPQGVMVDPANPTLLVAPIEPTGPTKESSGALTPPVYVVDDFKPDKPLALRAVRAATRITLRWTASPATDLVGYRVYRRHLVDDPCDPRYLPDDDSPATDDEADEESDDDSDEPDCLDTDFSEVADGEAAEDDIDRVEGAPNDAGTSDELPEEEEDGAGDNLVVGDNSADEASDNTTGDNADGDDAVGEAEGDQPSDDAEGGADDNDAEHGDAEDSDAEDSEAEDGDAEDGDADDSETDTDESGGESAETKPDDDDEPAGRRRRRNELVAGGWEMLTAVVISELRYTDPTASNDTAWEFAVEAIDDAGNVSEPGTIKVRLENEVEEQ